MSISYLCSGGARLLTDSCLLCESCHMVDDRGNVSGPVELHCLQGLVVGLHHTLDASTVRVLPISIQWELMRHLASNHSTKPKCWKELVTVLYSARAHTHTHTHTHTHAHAHAHTQ